MIDQSHINLLQLVPTRLKHVGGTGGGEYHGPCPFCGGTDRFIVQPAQQHWWCRQCGRGGDPVALVMELEQLDFKAASDRLNLTLPERSGAPRRPPLPQPPVPAGELKDCACFEPAWQSAAEAFVYDCAGALWDHWKGSAGRYLEARGIPRDNAISALLGVNLTEYRATWGSVEVWLPRGIIIPWEIDRQIWNIRVRRPNADLASGGDKYIGPRGGTALAMYRVDSACPGSTVIMTEGEFDALVVQRALMDRGIQGIRTVSIGSNTGARLLRWVSRLSLADQVLLAFDNDAAGDAAAGYWSAALGRIVRRLRPTRKDLTEMWQAGEPLAAWILGEVSG